jgi:hypothetical protein
MIDLTENNSKVMKKALPLQGAGAIVMPTAKH